MAGTALLKLGFGAAAATILYSYVGYPAWLLVAGWLRPGPVVRKDSITPDVTLVIVAHNEERVIEAKLRNCLDLDYPKGKLDVVVASDGSSDRTDEIVAGFGADGVRLLRLQGPQGKANALNHALPASRGEIVVLCDARQILDPGSLRALVANLADPAVGAASGELHIDTSSGSAAGEGVGAYWRYEKLIRRLQSRLGSTVGVTGALYALRRTLYRQLDPRLILDDVAIPLDVVAAGYRVVFEPTASARDVAAESPAREYGRKVRTLAGNYQLLALRPWLLNPRRNPLFFHFVSHKLSRLAVPWCLLTLLLCSALLALGGHPFFVAALAAQALFYAVALLGFMLDRRGVRAPLLAFPYAFTLLNLAAASALWRFLRGRETAAWKKAA